MRFERCGLPRIPDHHLYGAVYLYRSVEAARAGDEAGGTGFVIIHPFGRVPGRGVLCVVTNKHVAHHYPVPRINRADGREAEPIPLEPHDWFYHRKPHDLAIAVGVLNDVDHRYMQIATDRILTPNKMKEYDIGVGDDVFMVGRFIGHEGKVHNQATMRFGNISATPRAMYNVEAGYQEESFAVEMHSRSGYSGSPVLVYGTTATRIFKDVRRDGDHGNFMFLLGVNWGQIQERRPLRDKEGRVIDGPHVREPSGLNGVVPAWHILSLLKQDEVEHAISKVEALEIARLASEGSVIEPSTDPAAKPKQDD
jgi:hypothetical protein